MNKKHMVWVGPHTVWAGTHEVLPWAQLDHMQVEIHTCTDLNQLWQHLYQHMTTPHMILFDAHVICDTPGVTQWDILHMLSVWHRCKTHMGSCAIAVYVTAQTPMNLIKQLHTQEVLGVVPDPQHWGHTECMDALQNLLAGHHHWPKCVLNPSLKRLKTQTKTQTPRLTPRQAQVLHLITTLGASNKVIARSLKISESTVKVHIGAILRKYGVRNRTQLALCGVNGRL